MTWLFDWALSLVPWWVWVGVFAGIGLIIWGFSERFVLLAWAVAGWKGLVGGLVIVLTALAFLWSILRPRKGVSTEDQYDPFKPRNFGIPRKPSTLREPGEQADDWFKRVTGQGGDGH